MNKTTPIGDSSRRDFLKTSSTAAMASAATLNFIARSSAYAQNSDTIRVGLVGCGGRGTGAANQALTADENVKLTAVADVFPDKVDRAVNILKKQHVCICLQVTYFYLFHLLCSSFLSALPLIKAYFDPSEHSAQTRGRLAWRPTKCVCVFLAAL